MSDLASPGHDNRTRNQQTTSSPRSHARSHARSPSHPSTPILPSKFRVPAVPSRIHRRLYLNPLEDGLSISPTPLGQDGGSSGSGSSRWSDDAILIQWGPKGLISRQTHRPLERVATAEELEIGGIVGLVRLWETSYLLVFLRPPSSNTTSSANSTSTSSPAMINPNGPSHPDAIRIFPKPKKNAFPPFPLDSPSSVDDGSTGEDPLIKSLRAIAEREGLIIPKSVNTPERSREADSRDSLEGKDLGQGGHGGESAGREEAEEDQEEQQGTVYELKQVYAIPLTRDGSEGVIKGIKAGIAKLKSKQPTRKPVPDSPGAPASASNARSTSAADGLSASTSSDNANNSDPTPLQAFTRALDPKRWTMPKIGGIGGLVKPSATANATLSPEDDGTTIKADMNDQVAVDEGGDDATVLKEEGVFDDAARAAETAGIQTGTGSGDLGESRLLGEQTEARHKSAEGVVPVLPKEPAIDSEETMPDAEQIMADIPATQTTEEKEKAEQSTRTSFLGIGTGKVWNPFVRQPSKAAVPTVSKNDKADADGHGQTSLEEDDDVTGGLGDEYENAAKIQEEKASVKTPAQRKDFENKIIREICKLFGGSGGMFYSFETDLSHNLQEKRKKLESRTQSTGLLGQLLKKEDQSRPSLHLDSVHATPLLSPGEEATDPAAYTKEKQDQSRSFAPLEADAEATGHTWIEPDIHLPLWRRVDPRFMWNGWLVREFQELGLHSYIIPIIQGWVQSSRFYIPPMMAEPLMPAAAAGKPYRTSLDVPIAPPSIPVDLVLISRRSKERAGLRYLRRGIDEDGNVANFVETEMMIRVEIEGKWSIFSFVQIRGSIPLVWTQNSTLADLKPAPVLERPVDQTLGITRLHFEDIKRRYGSTTIVNLAELTGKEGPLSQGYRSAVAQLQDDSVNEYIDFDFHNECRGLKYENISKLVESLRGEFGRQGYYWTCQNEVMRQQAGVFRVNCVDCLDRTGVTQSVLARHVLANQLQQVGILPDAASDIERVYNDAWANNGDQISLEYSGSSALKGRFTRTGKRDIQGMLNDGVNSLTRMYSANFSDHFSQAAISFATGERSISVFSEFLTSMQSSDSTAIIRLSRLRHAAIEVCSARCIADEGERRLNGWTMYAPESANVKTGGKMEEKVILLTKAALYVISFDYDLEKVVSSTQIPLRNITSIKKGAYILSPLQEAGRDPEENAGFQVFFKPAQTGTRFTSYTMLNAAPASPLPSAPGFAAGLRNRSNSSASDKGDSEPHVRDRPDSATEYFAFKALPREFVAPPGQQDDDEDESQAGPVPSCRDQVDSIVRRIREECVRAAGNVGGYVGGRAREDGFVVDDDVISLAEAQKATSITAKAEYAVKRLIWLG